VREGKRGLDQFSRNLPKIIRGYPHVLPYYLEVGLNIRLRMRCVDEAVGGWNHGLFTRHAALKRPDEKDRQNALAASPTKSDRHIRQTWGPRLLNVEC